MQTLVKTEEELLVMIDEWEEFAYNTQFLLELGT